MATWQAIVGGTTYSLSDSNPFKILNISGIGNAPVRRLEERGPFQDGSTDVGYRLDARLINVLIQITGASLSATDGHRDTLSNIFNPRGSTPVYLRCTRDDGAIRQIDCYVTGMLDMPAELGQRDMAAQRVGVQLKAPNPIWYNPTNVSTQLVPNSTPLWYTAGGLIDPSSVLAFGTAITSGTTWAGGTVSTLGSGLPYSLALRARGTSDIADYMFLFIDVAATQHYLQNTGGTTGQSSLVSYPGNTNATLGTGTNTYIFVQSADGVSLYENDTEIAWIYGARSRGIVVGSAWWGGSGASWNGTINLAAAYSLELNAQTRTALIESFATGGASYAAAGSVANTGSWDEYPVITIAGPLSDPIVKNATTGAILDFTGAVIPAGVTYTIDCRYGYKTVIDSNSTNQISKLSNDSDLSTFALTPGVNIINVYASNGGTVSISHYDRYLGL